MFFITFLCFFSEFRIPQIFALDISTWMYWMSCRRVDALLRLFCKYFMIIKFLLIIKFHDNQIFIERSSTRDAWTFEIFKPSLLLLCESNMKIDFLFHVMAKLKPAQLKIAPFPISLDVKCLWLVNKSILWKISFCFVIVTFLIHHRMINFSQIMWVHQQQEDDRLVNVSWVDHLHQRHDLNSRHYVKHSVIRVSSDPFRDKEFYRIFPHRGDNGSRTKSLFWHILRSEVFQIDKCSIFEKQIAKKALFVHIIPDV